MSKAKTKKQKKPATKKTRTEAEYQELRAATVALAKCANLVLASGGTLGGMTIDLKTKKAEHWSTMFFDALDMIGIKYDRDAYLKQGRKR